ncbi:MAG TPA: hypothetical protein VIL48_03735 [Acidimicrobiales bacterium]
MRADGARRLRPHLLLAAVAALGAVLPGCSSENDIGVADVQGELTFFVPLCGGRLTSIEVEDITDRGPGYPGRVLWRAEGSRRAERMAYGSRIGGGHRELVVGPEELRADYADRRLRVTAHLDGAPPAVGSFMLDDLPADGSAVSDGDDRPVGPDRLRSFLDDQCDPELDWQQLALPVAFAAWLVAALFGGIALAVRRA